MIPSPVEKLVQRLLLCLLLASIPSLAQESDAETVGEAEKPAAQIEVQPETSMRQILEQEEKAEQLVQEKAESTPRGELTGKTPLRGYSSPSRRILSPR